MRTINEDIEVITHTSEGFYIQKPDRPIGPIFRGDMVTKAMLKEAREKRLINGEEDQEDEEEQEDYR